MWTADGSGRCLIPIEEMADRECMACDFEWTLWDNIIEATGDLKWGEIAMNAMELDEYVQYWRIAPSSISEYDWQAIRAVKHEADRLRIQADLEAAQESKAR